MFTGIVEEVGRVLTVAPDRLVIAAQKVLEDVSIGDSIAVNGVCLTVTSFSRGRFTADVMPVTRAHTALGALRAGGAVNLERALTLSSRLGGHIVSGHIDGVGRMRRVGTAADGRVLFIEAEPDVLRYIVPRGSVALDGVSLTVVSVEADGFSVSLIPHTEKATAFSEKRTGDPVNIETDMIAKYVEKLLAGESGAQENVAPSALTREFFAAHGFS